MDYDVRKFTNKLIALRDEGMISDRDIVLAALKYMSEDDVRDMCECNGFDEIMNLVPDEDEDEALLSNFNYVGSRDHY
jgi:hypothetical protein